MIDLVVTHKPEMTFEDFIELSESVQPRLFTVASSYKVEKNVVIVASIVQNGLISKHFVRKPSKIYG